MTDRGAATRAALIEATRQVVQAVGSLVNTTMTAKFMNVKGCTTVSIPMLTPSSMYVLIGLTIVT